MIMRTIKSFFCFAILLGIGVDAAHAQLFLGLTAGVERIENPLLTSVSPGGVTVMRVAPTYAFEAQGDRMRMRFAAGAVIERSSNTALVASREYPSLDYRWTYNWPATTLELRGSVVDTATRNSDVGEVGLVTIDTRERSIEAGATWDHEISARTRVILNLLSSRVSYDTTLLEGYREQTVSSRFAWEGSERMVYFFEPSHARLMPFGQGSDASQSRWVVGASGNLSPEWSLTAAAGQSRFRDPQASTGSVTQLQLNYSGGLATAGIEWARDVTAGGMEAAYVATEAWGLRWGYRLAEGAVLTVRGTQSQSDGAAGGRRNILSLTLENELGAHWTSTLAIEERRFRDISGNSGKGRAIRAGLSYVYPGR